MYMGKKGFFVISLVILVLIFFLLPDSTGKEYFLVPEKIVDLEKFSDDYAPTHGGESFFEFDGYFGSFSDEMEISYLDKKKYKLYIADSFFFNFSRVSQILNVQNFDGSVRNLIEADGYPFIQDGKIAVLSHSEMALFDLAGNLYWKKAIFSMVTTLALSGDYVLIGYLDGYCELIDISGNSLLTYRPGGSRIEAIYGGTISSNGQYIAIISGLEPQRFIFLQNKRGGFKPIYHSELDNGFRRSVDMYFSCDDSKIFFESSQGVSIFDVTLKTVRPAGGSGQLVKIYQDSHRNLYSLLLADKGNGVLSIFTEENKDLIYRRFDGNSLFFKKRDSRYYIGFDNKLVYLKLVSR